MTQSRDPQKCSGARWCDEPDGHGGNHVQYVGEVLITDGWQPVRSLAVTLEAGRAETRPGLVVTVAASRPSRYHAVRLPWEQANELADMLATAGKRWRP